MAVHSTFVSEFLMNRSILVAPAALLLALFGCGGTDNPPATRDSTPNQAASESLADSASLRTECKLTWGTGACSGVAEFSLTDPSYAVKNAQWISMLNFPLAGFEADRTPVSGPGNKPRFQVQAITDAGSMAPLTTLADREVVIARFIITKSGKADARYGISRKLVKEYKDMFFLAVRKLEQSDTDPVNVAVANWRVYGITTDGKLDAIKSGLFRLCQKQHAGRPKRVGAYFMRCEDDPAVTAIAVQPNVEAAVGDLPLLVAIQREANGKALAPTLIGDRWKGVFAVSQTQTLLKVFQSVEDAPAWMVCGVGCCTADF